LRILFEGGSRTRENRNDGFDKSAGSRFVLRSYPKGEAQDVPSTSAPSQFNGGPAGSPATIVCKPRQGRKAATVVNDSGAGKRLAGPPPSMPGRSARSCRLKAASHRAKILGE